VLHNFENPKPVFERIASLLSKEGVLVLSEPSEVKAIFSIIRSLYRPFQSDKEWEWPFNKSTVASLESRLEPVEGFGWGRNSLFLSVLVSLPILGTLFLPIYLRMVRTEIEAGWDRKVWHNSTIVAVYKLRT